MPTRFTGKRPGCFRCTGAGRAGAGVGERAQKSLEFRDMLVRRTGLEVIMWDERLTTVAAEQTLIESGVRRENRKQYVDKIAAVFILQGYLDSIYMQKTAE